MKALIDRIADSRPLGDVSVEQYLMEKESLRKQVSLVRNKLNCKKVIFLGDDDHFSLLASHFFGCYSVVLEIDERILFNQSFWEKKLQLGDRHKIWKYDIRDEVPSFVQKLDFDFFYINPPYNSKNQAFGIKVWLSRSLEILKDGGDGLLIILTNPNTGWCVDNLVFVQEFLALNNSCVYRIDSDAHSYLNDRDNAEKSSNLWIHYQGGACNMIKNPLDNLYR